jgi:hypothetical protein
VTPEPRSFDAARPRAVPARATGTRRDGTPWTVTLASPTLIVAVKAQCDGCRPFVLADLPELAGVELLVVSQSAGDPDWDGAVRDVLVSPALLEDLDVRWPPFYLLVDPATGRVLVEGVVFAPAQVAAEIAPYLA